MRKEKTAKQPTPKRADDKGWKQTALQTTQQTIPFRGMFRDGVCHLNGGIYTKTVAFEDMNYQLIQVKDQPTIFDGWNSFLNYFDNVLPFQLSFINHRPTPEGKYTVNILPRHDGFDSIRTEYVEILESQIAKSNNGIVRSKFITFDTPADSVKAARPRLEQMETDIIGNLKQLNIQSRPLAGQERLGIPHGQLHPGGREFFSFSWELTPQTGVGTKDFIAPAGFDFRRGRFFKVGATWGAASYLQITALELIDKLLAELLELDTEVTVTIHVQTVDQVKAIKTIKDKLTDVDEMETEERKKAVRSGYDVGILPPDLVIFSKDAKTLLEDLQSRNGRIFLLTFLIVNMAPVREQLESELFAVSDIAQRYNCAIRRLDLQQERGFMSSLPLGFSAVEIQRGLITSSTAIFIPFLTQELHMDGEAIYYSLNAPSHNIIMANRKKLRNPNGLFLEVPGSGKSFAAKRELVNVFLATNDKILAMDATGEYSALTRRLGGQVVEIAPDSPSYINPMSLTAGLDSSEENLMALKAGFVLFLMELIVGGRDDLQPVERAVIDRCVWLVYRDCLQHPDTAKMPVLQDLYEILCEQTELETAWLATSLKIYVTGSLNVSNHTIGVDLSGRLVCLDPKKLGAGLRIIAMLIMQDLVNSQVPLNFVRGIATWCYSDKFHLLLKDLPTTSYCVTVWKMLRGKFYVPSVLTQNIKDLLANQEVENIFGATRWHTNITLWG